MNDTIRGLPNGDFEVERRAGMHPALGMGYDGAKSACATCGGYWCAGCKPAPRAHSHYFKDVSKLKTIDVYRALALFNVSDPCLQHAVKKLLVAGGRGGGKDISRDIQEAIDTLTRWQEMRTEEAAA
jgi:hypothetical protein